MRLDLRAAPIARKALVGTGQGDLQLRSKKGADPEVTLKIASVKQEDGKWVAEGRSASTKVGVETASGR